MPNENYGVVMKMFAISLKYSIVKVFFHIFMHKTNTEIRLSIQ